MEIQKRTKLWITELKAAIKYALTDKANRKTMSKIKASESILKHNLLLVNYVGFWFIILQKVSK